MSLSKLGVFIYTGRNFLGKFKTTNYWTDPNSADKRHIYIYSMYATGLHMCTAKTDTRLKVRKVQEKVQQTFIILFACKLSCIQSETDRSKGRRTGGLTYQTFLFIMELQLCAGTTLLQTNPVLWQHANLKAYDWDEPQYQIPLDYFKFIPTMPYLAKALCRPRLQGKGLGLSAESVETLSKIPVW